jgi:hypothetical protein
VKFWLILALAGGVIGLQAYELDKSNTAAKWYAELVVTCANGVDFIIADRIVHCSYTEVVVWEDE